ncbi:MAG: restriction endonuclease subunit S, partial [Patescibacteria group bacterium]|nr:restriction endonuclease subunit S [Patescibacteria group bacterium]
GSIGSIVWSQNNFYPIDTTYFVLLSHKDSLKYFFYKLTSLDLKRLNTASGVPGLNREEVYKQKILLPPLPEQQKIAEILGAVDEDIEKTDAVIAETEKLKKGLMQELFAFKNSKEKKISDIFEIGRGRVISKKEIQANPGPYPVYSSQTSNNGEFGKLNTYDFDGEYLTWTTDGIYAGAVFYRNGKFNCTNVCGTLKPKVDMDIRYFSYILPVCVEKYVVRTANPKLMNNIVASIAVPFLSLEKQKQISEILSAVDDKIFANKNLKSKLLELKKGLMGDLLSGRVRVK